MRLSKLGILAGLLVFGSWAQAENSISSLSLLSPVLIHHYTCRLALVINREADNYKETNFDFNSNIPAKAESLQTLTLLKDEVQALANATTLDLKWLRDGRVIANSMAQIQNSTTQAMVMLVSDPADEQSQVQFNCNAVTYQDLAKSVSPARQRGSLQ